MTSTHITLLVEDLGRLVAAADASERLPSLEQIFSRGVGCPLDSDTPNHLRFAFFGIEHPGDLPVAALTHVNDREHNPRNDYFWLRTDPVTMWADMARVFMTDYGFADLNPFERNEIENCIRSVLEEEGIQMHSDHPERWCIALDKPLDFDFTPLDEAIGMDVADALPNHPEARYWRRILNEIQVALHNCPVNVSRRMSGKQEINSVWFWGGGFIPDAAPHDIFDTVYSNHPVTRGLAIINDCRLKRKSEVENTEFKDDGRSILIDWSIESRDPKRELMQIEWLSQRLLALVKPEHVALTLFDGSGQGRIYDRKSGRRFWRRNKPLNHLLPGAEV
mgnify:FL=1